MFDGKKFISYTRDPAEDPGAERWEYLGNIFNMLSYARLTGTPEPKLPLWMCKEGDR